MGVTDKPVWVRHDGLPIFSLDVDPSGSRLATAGQDNKIRIWGMGPILNPLESTQPRALATINDHHGAVNVVRFAPHSKQLASGSCDKWILIHTLQPGTGKTRVGDKEPASIENWRQTRIMRGHNMDIVDLCWSPDGTKVASCSMDNMVIIWDAGTGRSITTLSGHHGFVKGVAWDPFDHFLASQGETDGVFIWSTRDWSIVAKSSFPLDSTAPAQFARLSWSPEGQRISATCGYDGVHQAPLVLRNNWTAPNQLCGHRSVICVAKHSPHMYGKRDDPTNQEVTPMVALGSTDHTISVWSTFLERPIVIKDSFKGAVLDVAWTPDGYTLLACGYDGSITRVSFSVQELGPITEAPAMEELVTQLFGQQPKRGHGTILVAGPDLMAVEQNQVAVAPAAARPPTTVRSNTLPPQGPASPKGPPGVTAALSARMSGAPPPTAPAARKRLAPTPIGDTALVSPVSSPPPGRVQTAPPVCAPDGPPPPKRVAPTPVAAPSASARPAPAPSAPARPAPASQVMVGALPISGVVSGNAAAPLRFLLPCPALLSTLSVRLGHRTPAGPYPCQPEEVVLEATNNPHDPAAGGPSSRLRCLAGNTQLWFDAVQGGVCLATGTLNFAAVATSTGDLLVFSAAGRRLFPPIQLGAAPAFMATNEAWQLLVLSADAQLRVWDVQAAVCTLTVSAAPLLAGQHTAVAAVRLSTSGAPLIVLRNHHAYTWHLGMQCWMRVADESFSASLFHSAGAGAHGELGRVQADAAVARPPALVTAASAQPPRVQHRAARAHLETNVAAAGALRSGSEWRRWLLTYVRQLAADEDQARLREVVNELLGPIRYHPDTHSQAQSLGPRTVQDQIQQGPSAPEACQGWSPSFLGMDKRTLLKNDVLREIQRTRTASNQQLTQEVLGQLKEAALSWTPTQIVANAQVNAAAAPGQVTRGVLGQGVQQMLVPNGHGGMPWIRQTD